MAEQTAAAPKPRPSWLKPLEHPLVVLGELSMFAGQSATSIFRRPYRVGLLMVQLEFMAYGSMFVVGLTMLFTAIALFGAYGVAVWAKDLSPGTFLNRIQTLVDVKDITNGLGKAAVIGFVVTMIACYRGYRAEGGARGVGIATTQAVVGGLVAIFAIDYIYTAISLSGPQQPAGGLGG